MARFRTPGISLLLAGAVLAGAALMTLQSCTPARAVTAVAGRIDRVWLGFALDREGRVTPGCAASKFALRDPIHLSMQVTDAVVGSVVTVSVRDVVSHRIAWSENRPVPPGRSDLTFAIGRDLALGRYRAESTLGGEAAKSWDFEVHHRREGAR